MYIDVLDFWYYLIQYTSHTQYTSSYRDAPQDEEESLLRLVVGKMENAMKLSVPLVVDHGSGNSWLEAH